jgi:hypothetical protein
MARIKKASGVKLLLKVEDTETPGLFVAFCSINAARGIVFSSTFGEFPDIDCDDLEAVAWIAREKKDVSASITGAGTLNTPDVAEFYAWKISPDPRNCQVVVDVDPADGGVIFEGAFHLGEFGITGDRGAKMECNISAVSDGEVTLVSNAS